jgi:pimeloyl-ACP methyl ester carboxylesterase
MVVLKSARRHLHYEDVGAGRLILLVHGFTSYGLSWAPQLAALVHSGYRVIIPDLYGHGASSPATALNTVSDLAADMVGAFSITLVPGQSLSAVYHSARWFHCRWPSTNQTAWQVL